VILRATLACGIVVLTTACGSSSDRSGRPPVSARTTARLGVDTIASGLDVPWSIAFAPDGRIFITERAGRVRIVDRGTLRPEPWATLPVAARGEAGLMGLALAPDFATTRELFVVGTFEKGSALVNRVIRLTEGNGRGVRPTVIRDDIPSAIFHAGDAVAFGPDGMLYVATGDARDPSSAQDERSLAGKILRLRRDGSIPDDNPVRGSLVYARGVRNTQGLTWDPATRQMFGSEHGPSGFPNEYLRRDRDELNAIAAGANLGWPTVSGRSGSSRFAAPLVEWSSPGIAPSGVAWYAGPYAPWRNSLFVAALKGEQLRRVSVERDSTVSTGWRASGDEPLFVNTFGRLRALAVGPDGMVYFTTSNRDGRGVPRPGDDHLLRLRVDP
jgi:aldose sugar dehydrogenase